MPRLESFQKRFIREDAQWRRRLSKTIECCANASLGRHLWATDGWSNAYDVTMIEIDDGRR